MSFQDLGKLLSKYHPGNVHQDIELNVDLSITTDAYIAYQQALNSFNKNDDVLTKIYPYQFINPDDEYTSILKKKAEFVDVKEEDRTRIVRIVENADVLTARKGKLLKYKPMNSGFFYTWEILQNFNLDGQKILEISNFPTFLEAYHYHATKYEKPKMMKLLFLERYLLSIASKERQLREVDHYIQYLETELIKDQRELNSIIFDQDDDDNNNNKSDLVFVNLIDEKLDDLQQLFYQLLLGLYHLENKGSMVIFTKEIKDQATANIVLLGKFFFQDLHIYQPETRACYKERSVFLIFKNLNEDKEPFTKILKNILSLKDDLSPHLKKMVPITLNHKAYDVIRNFNGKSYMCKMAYITSALQDLDVDVLRNEQYINSIIWARKYDLKYYELKDDRIHKDFEKLILQDLYAIHRPISKEFTPPADDDLDKTPASDLIKDLDGISVRLQMMDFIIDSRDFRKWSTVRRKVAFYRPMFKEIDLVKRVQRITGIPTLSQAWLKLFEILVQYPLLPKGNEVKEVKTFHLCEAPGNFISATEYFVKERTEIKILDWKAQSLHPSLKEQRAFQDDYGIIRNNPNRWLWGPKNTGDITDPENIKYYSSILNGVKLFTADCGICLETKNSDEIISKIIFSEILIVLKGLDDGANAVLKVFPKFRHPALLSSFYALYDSFEKLIVHKSSLNRQSQEFYIICLNRKKRDEMVNQEMFEAISNFDQERSFYESYPTAFVSQMERVMNDLADNFIFEIERVVYYFDHYDELGVKDQNLIKKYIQKKNDDWLEMVGMID